MTTKNEILTAVYNIIATSPINDLNGGVYKNYRPVDTKLEDTVISLIPGINGKFLLDGALQVKIFYQDIRQGGSYYEDTLNGSEKETLLYNLSQTLLYESNIDISFEIQTREIYTARLEDTKEHYAILKINYKITQI